ncbi:rna-directed dna polymerase from mobile element jockey-like [Limosa lapponica baueri]|uniref:Rna-directed dna polymerase from mobile element jockey-like n=1 Tax=Limosa lapponica baueri TaxID=1758121 RepID=A0A2I0TP94_LIMLA|nr:rna-directed dna polymerase from mobile element jockey-like [Limosa lapponica baueri]
MASLIAEPSEFAQWGLATPRMFWRTVYQGNSAASNGSEGSGQCGEHNKENQTFENYVVDMKTKRGGKPDGTSLGFRVDEGYVHPCNFKAKLMAEPWQMPIPQKLSRNTCLDTHSALYQWKLVLDQHFSVLVNNIDVGIECTVSEYADDTKLSDVVDTPEGCDAIQRDLNRLEECACVSLMMIKKAKCKVLHLGQGNPQYQYKLGNEEIESIPA